MSSCPGPAVDGVCGKKIKYRGLCAGHAEQDRKGWELRPMRRSGHGKPPSPCSFEGCPQQARCRALCWGHYDQDRRGQALRPIRPRRAPNSSSERDVSGRKYCPACEAWKHLGDFSPRPGKADGHRENCRDCINLARITRVYGLSRTDYMGLLAAQDGACAICESAFSEDNVPAVDHDHGCCPGRAQSCGRCVRGLLCSRCNLTLGAMQDNPAWLRSAADYVEAAR